MESHVINRIRRHLLSLAIFFYGNNKSYQKTSIVAGYFPMESLVINRIRRHLLSLAIFSHGKSCNKSYYKTSIAVGYIFPWKVV